MHRERVMSRRRRNAMKTLQRARNFAAGVLIGSAGITPVFAATDIAINDLSRPLLSGSVVLLVIGLALKAKRRQDGAQRAGCAVAAPSARASDATGCSWDAATRTSAAAGVLCGWPRVSARDARHG